MSFQFQGGGGGIATEQQKSTIHLSVKSNIGECQLTIIEHINRRQKCFRAKTAIKWMGFTEKMFDVWSVRKEVVEIKQKFSVFTPVEIYVFINWPVSVFLWGKFYSPPQKKNFYMCRSLPITVNSTFKYMENILHAHIFIKILTFSLAYRSNSETLSTIYRWW